MIPVHQGCPREARAERGVHAASASKMKAGWLVLVLDRFGHCCGLKPALLPSPPLPFQTVISIRAGTLTRSGAVPALQARERFDGIYPGLRSRTRSSLGYNMAGFQPSGGARHRPSPCRWFFSVFQIFAMYPVAARNASGFGGGRRLAAPFQDRQGEKPVNQRGNQQAGHQRTNHNLGVNQHIAARRPQI